MRLLIVGCGYVGTELVRLLDNAWEIFALTRSDVRAAELSQFGIRPIVGNWLGSLPEPLPKVDYVLVSVPHRPDEHWLGATHGRGLEFLLTRLPEGWQKLIYLSTTGVFGDCASQSVDEDTPVSPERIGPQIAVEAENWLQTHYPSSTGDRQRFTVLRLAGIYGPGRIPLADRIRAGEPLAVPQDGFLNLVHVADIARMIERVLPLELNRNCYVFSDGHPVGRDEFYRYLARLCGVSEPRFVSPDASDARVRRATSKRVDPSRLIGETHFEFRFPDYQSGLIDALGES